MGMFPRRKKGRKKKRKKERCGCLPFISGRDKVAWSSDPVKRLFTNPAPVFNPTKESSRLGLILGTVVGTLAVLIVGLILTSLYCRRRNRRNPLAGPKWPPSWSSAFHPTNTNTHTTGSTIGGTAVARPPTERFELADTQVGAELDSRPVQFELYSPQQQRAGWLPVRESWASGDTSDEEGGEVLTPMTPVRIRFRDAEGNGAF
jgi:hypothetical protein